MIILHGSPDAVARYTRVVGVGHSDSFSLTDFLTPLMQTLESTRNGVFSPSLCSHVLCFLWSVDVRVSSCSVPPRLIVLHPSIQLGQTLTASVLLEKALNHICSSFPKWGFAASFFFFAPRRSSEMLGYLPEQSRPCISAKAAVSRFQPAALFHVCCSAVS